MKRLLLTITVFMFAITLFGQKISDLTTTTSSNDVDWYILVQSGNTRKTAKSSLLQYHAKLASPTFTGTVGLPASWGIDGTAVTASAAEINVLDGALDGDDYYVKRLKDSTAVTDNYTLVLGDAGNDLFVTKASQAIITIPTNASVAFPIGTKINVFMMGAGIVTFSGSTYSMNDSTTINTRYGGATLIKRGTNNWLLIGALQD